MVELYAVALPQPLSREAIHALLPRVSPEKRAKILRFAFPEDACRCLLGDLLTRRLVSRKCGAPEEQVRFRLDEHDKPRVLFPESFHFNITHSGDWVVVAVSTQPVGVDVERVKPMDFDLSERFFSPQEHAWLMAREESQRTAAFFDLWTLKESYLKAVGKGLSLPLSAFTIRFQAGAIRIETPKAMVAGFRFRQYELDPAYKLSVCARENRFARRVRMLSFSALGS